MDIINKLKEYNKLICGAWISAKISHFESVILLYKIPGSPETSIYVFETCEEFISSNPMDILEIAGFIRVNDKM